MVIIFTISLILQIILMFMLRLITINCYCLLILTCISVVPLFAQNTQNWQQKIATTLQVTLDDKQHMLRAHIMMDYTNNSPDTLHYIYMHLYPNAYKNNQTALAKQFLRDNITKFYYSTDEEKGWIDSLDFKVNQVKTIWEKTADIDVVKLLLPSPLLPGSTVEIATPFRVKLPIVFSRLGHAGQSYQISQWFPKTAVYDNKGWHAFPYLNYGEFYSEFGSYDVSITLPKNYIVMATGNLVNEEEHAWLQTLYKETLEDTKKRDTISDTAYKTIRFTENNIHDFAWFADKKWKVGIDTIVDTNLLQPVIAYSCYFPHNHAIWKHSLEHAKQAIVGFSNKIGAYPYQTVKIVEGALKAGGGMEYPTVTIINAVSSVDALQQVVVHEIGHNWFYGMLASNERQHAWMDEGFTSYYEQKICNENKAVNTVRLFDEDRLYRAVSAAVNNAHGSQPICLHSNDFSEKNYGLDLYYRSVKMIAYLAAYMGTDIYNNAMQQYFMQWQFKHPSPEDLQNVLQAATNKDISWFFTTAITSALNPDFKVGKKINENQILVHNKRALKVPIQVYYVNGTDTVFSEWKISNAKVDTVTFEQVPDNNAVINISPVIPDTWYSNNSSKQPFKIRAFMGLNDQAGNKMWIAPALGYNLYDGFMLGGLLHNLSIPTSKVQFGLAPMFGFKSQELSGAGFVHYDIYFKKGFINKIAWSLQGKSFTFFSNKSRHYPDLRYYKLAPAALFHFRKPYFNGKIERSLRLKLYAIQLEKYTGYVQIDNEYYPSSVKKEPVSWYYTMQYLHKNVSVLNPFSYQLDLQANKEFIKLGLVGKVKIDYGRKNKGVNLRGFAGKFIPLVDHINSQARHFLTINHGGVNDYLLDETYIGRTARNDFWANQSSGHEGAFYSNTALYARPIGLSDNWMLGANVSIDLPFSPLKIFGNFVYSKPSAYFLNLQENTWQYEMGLELKINDWFAVAAPLIVSKDIRDYRRFILGDAIFWRTLSFRINLAQLQYDKLAIQALNL